MQHRYPYQLSQRTLQVVCFLGGPILAFSVFAIYSSLGLSMLGAVQLSPGTARFFYSGFALLGLAILVWGGWMLKIGVRHIEIDADSVTLPASMMSKEMVKVPFAQIQDLDITEYGGSVLLHIMHSRGKCKLESPHFESFDAFNDLANRLHRAVD